MPDILGGAVSRSSPAMREGHLVLMHYLPITMGAHFQPMLQVGVECRTLGCLV